MSYKNIQSDSFIPKQEIPREIESNQIFSYELFEYRLNHQESEITSLKEDTNNKFDRLNSSILRVEKKLILNVKNSMIRLYLIIINLKVGCMEY